MKTLFAFLVSLAATALGAISGIGGGVIIKPVMDAVFSLSTSQISFLSGCTVLAMSAVSIGKRRTDLHAVLSRSTALLTAGSAVGGVAGSAAFSAVLAISKNSSMILTVQSALMILMTAAVLVYVLIKHRLTAKRLSSPLLCLLAGTLLGALSAFLGIGGGPLNILVLCYFFGMNAKQASISSIFMIFCSQLVSLVTKLAEGRLPEVSLLLLGAMIAGGVLGGILGGGFSKRLSSASVDKLFSVMLILILLICAYNLSSSLLSFGT